MIRKLDECEALFTRVEESIGPGYFELEIIDNKSRLKVVSVKLSLESIADFMSNRSTDCEVEYNSSPNIGNYMSLKEEYVPVGDAHNTESLAEKIREFTKANLPEWQADNTKWSFLNLRTIDGTKCHKVIFRKWG